MAQVEPTPTPITERDLLRVVAEGHLAEFNTPAPIPALLCAMAQVAIETARGAKCKRHNLGGLTAGIGWKEAGNPWFRSDATGISFRAYPSFAAGANDYWALLGDFWPEALEKFSEADPYGAAMAMQGWYGGLAHAPHYPESMYKLYEEYRKRFTTGAPMAKPPPDYPGEYELFAPRWALRVGVAGTLAALAAGAVWWGSKSRR